jgi:undecaprenyl pyrophosphate phosphatase UppP
MSVRWHEPMDARRLPLAGVLAAILAVGVNAGVRQAGRHWLQVPPGEPALSLLRIISTSLAAVVVATLALGVLSRTQARPFSVFRTLSAVVLLASCAVPLIARLGWLPGVSRLSTATMTTLLLMHLASAAVIVAFLTTLPRASARRRF